MSNLKVVSLFSGIGGFEVGLKNSVLNGEIVFASEIDKFAQKSYIANFGSKNLHGDIKKIIEKDIPDHDLLLAGFPCQSFSIAGKQKGFEDIRGTLFFDIVRILKEKKPKFVLLENVKNIISHDNSRTIMTVVKKLNQLGYIVDFTIINSNEAGLAQSRDRTYIFAILTNKYEKFTTDKRSQKVDKLKRELNHNNFKGCNFFNQIEFSNKQQFIEDILEQNVLQNYYFNDKKISNFLKKITLKDEKNENKIIKILDLPKEIIKDLERQRRVYSIKGISPTILARSDTTKILIIEDQKKKIRKITPNENFYLQGFDKNFVDNIVIAGISPTQMYKQSGNAVSPPVITGILNAIHKQYIKHIKFIDLFCGLGGFRIAFEKLGCKCVFSSDIDKYATQTYKANFGELPLGDITKINSNDIPQHDILCAGFPCQPFSIAGKRQGFRDTRGTLFFDVLRILKSKRPKMFFLENVSGICSHDNGQTLKIIIDSLKEINYIPFFKVINAKDVGYPQNRARWYCVGFDKKCFKNIHEDFIFNFPKEQKLKYTVDSLIEEKSSTNYQISKTCKDNISNHFKIFKKNERYNTKHELIANEVRRSKCNFRCDGISPCLTAKMGTGGNNIPVLVKQNRKLSERECLRIMGFPDSYKITQNHHQSYKQIGNSVVVPIIEDIATELIKILKTI